MKLVNEKSNFTTGNISIPHLVVCETKKCYLCHQAVTTVFFFFLHFFSLSPNDIHRKIPVSTRLCQIWLSAPPHFRVTHRFFFSSLFTRFDSLSRGRGGGACMVCNSRDKRQLATNEVKTTHRWRKKKTEVHQWVLASSGARAAKNNNNNN